MDGAGASDDGAAEDSSWSCVAGTFIVAAECELCTVCHTKRPSGAELAVAVDAAAAIRTANQPVQGPWPLPTSLTQPA